MKLELLRAYKILLSEFGPGRAARLMRLSPKEEREALRILMMHENDVWGRKDERGPLDGA